MISFEEFVNRSVKVHGKKYEYIKETYRGVNNNVEIICPEHGKFLQNGRYHTKGGNCPSCSKLKKLTTEDFIKRAKKIHGDKYDYSLAEYKNSKTKVKIICPEHGVFEQRPDDHLKGYGCRKCKNVKLKNKREFYKTTFLDNAKKIHGDKYDYSLVEYTNIKDKIKIKCPAHGIFLQIPNDHLNGSGCPECAHSARIEKISFSRNEFIKKAREIHGDKYDYSLVDYINNKTKVKIICPVHGIFEQTPAKHLQNQGCRQCGLLSASDKLRSTREEFIKRAQKVHSSKYDYSKVEYINAKTKVKIVCPEHGVFEQQPNMHLQGQGCPECALTGFNPNKPATLYYLLDQETGLYKIGITNKTIEERFPNADGSKRNMIILEQTYYENGYEALEAEQEILEAFSYCRCVNESWPENWGGRTEFFKEDILLKDINYGEKK